MQEKNWDIQTPIELICSDDHYLIHGKKYVRVTRVNGVIAKPELNNWYGQVGNGQARMILKRSSEFGSMIHKLIQVVLSDNKISEENYDVNLLESMAIFNKWKNEHNIKVHSVEQRLWSDKYKYAGTADFIGCIDEKMLIGDWKTSKNIYSEHWLQLSAYVIAFEELTNIKIDGVFIFQIRDGKCKYEEKSRDDMIKLFEVFKAAMVIHRWKYAE